MRLSFLFLVAPAAVMQAGIAESFSPAPAPEASPPKGGMPGLVLLDRDGVINRDVGSPGVVDVADLRLTPKAARAVGRLKRHGCRIGVVTNQSCVGKGLLSEEGLETVHDRLRGLLLAGDADAVLDRIYVCTSATEDPRRKPNPGMVEEARSDLEGGTGGGVVMIGDTLTDLRAAAAGGVDERILVQTGYGHGIMGQRPAPTDGRVARVVSSRGLAGDLPPWFRGTVVEVTPEHDGIPASVLPFWYAENLFVAVSWLANEFALRPNPRDDHSQSSS